MVHFIWTWELEFLSSHSEKSTGMPCKGRFATCKVGGTSPTVILKIQHCCHSYVKCLIAAAKHCLSSVFSICPSSTKTVQPNLYQLTDCCSVCLCNMQCIALFSAYIADNKEPHQSVQQWARFFTLATEKRSTRVCNHFQPWEKWSPPLVFKKKTVCSQHVRCPQQLILLLC